MPTDSERQTAKATLIYDIAKTWTAWVAFIAEQQAEQQMDDTAADTTAAPDLLIPATGGHAPTQTTILVEVRQQMETILEQRRQVAWTEARAHATAQGAAMPDPDQVFRDLLTTIDNELHGRVHPDGLALVWWDGRLQAFNHQHVANRTREETYLAAGPRQRMPRTVAFGGIAVVVVLTVIVLRVGWGLILGDTPREQTTTDPVIWVGSVELPIWDIQTLALPTEVVPVEVAALGPPLQICGDLADGVAPDPGATLVVTGTTSVRLYQVVDPETTAGTDLLVTPCPRGPPVARAVLQQAHTRQGGDTALIQEVHVRDTTLAPDAIPVEHMEVILHVTLADATGTLLLADGSRWAPTGTAPHDDGTELRYLVPAYATAQTAGWEVVDPTHPLPMIVPLTIPSPQDRAQVLATHLRVEDAEVGMARTATDTPQAVLTITLTLQDRAVLALQPSDVQWFIDDTPQALPSTLAMPTLEADTPGVLTLPLPVTGGRMLEVRVGTWRAVLRTETDAAYMRPSTMVKG